MLLKLQRWSFVRSSSPFNVSFDHKWKVSQTRDRQTVAKTIGLSGRRWSGQHLVMAIFKMSTILTNILIGGTLADSSSARPGGQSCAQQ